MLTLVAVVWVAGVLVATSDLHGTGANIGDPAAASLVTSGCPPTRTTPGGRNNYRPRAAFGVDLGHGFVVSGTVRGPGCAPLGGLRLQVWSQSATEDEPHHRGSFRTAPDGTFRVESDPLRAQFGEPNVHVAYDEGTDGPFRPVFVRTVVGEDAPGARVDLVLVPQR